MDDSEKQEKVENIDRYFRVVRNVLFIALLASLPLLYCVRELSRIYCTRAIESTTGSWTDKSGPSGNYITFDASETELKYAGYFGRGEFRQSGNAIFFKQPGRETSEKIDGTWSATLREPRIPPNPVNSWTIKDNPLTCSYEFSFSPDLGVTDCDINPLTPNIIVIRGNPKQSTNSGGFVRSLTRISEPGATR